MIWVPPGGAAATSQQTPAAKAAMGLLRPAKASTPKQRRRALKKFAKVGKKTRRKASKLKFGSPAWQKKYGAKAKRNRRKKK